MRGLSQLSTARLAKDSDDDKVIRGCELRSPLYDVSDSNDFNNLSSVSAGRCGHPRVG
jgi:hypothetical protein